MDLIYIFTFDYSLSTWEKSGHISREASYFKALLGNVHSKITLVTYGDQSDFDLMKYFGNIEVIPIYSLTNKPKSKILRYLKSFYYPFLIKKNLVLGSKTLVKQNQLMGSWVSIILKYLIGSRLVTRTGYDMYSFAKYENKSFYIKFLYLVLTQVTLIFSDAYTSTSKVDIKFIKKTFFFSREKIYLVPNWVHYQKKAHNIKRNLDTVLSIGRIEEQKNLFQLVDELSGFNLKILHIGEGQKKHNLLDYAEKKGVALTILNNLDNLEIYSLLMKHYIFVSLSNFEGNSKTILEALGSGCIVFASDIINNRELIQNRKNGILINLENPQLALNINQTIADKKTCENISSSAVNKIIEENSLSVVVELEKKVVNFL
jgi:glycosyltransferase involved in cell wall biosynthesis